MQCRAFDGLFLGAHLSRKKQKLAGGLAFANTSEHARSGSGTTHGESRRHQGSRETPGGARQDSRALAGVERSVRVQEHRQFGGQNPNSCGTVRSSSRVASEIAPRIARLYRAPMMPAEALPVLETEFLKNEVPVFAFTVIDCTRKESKINLLNIS